MKVNRQRKINKIECLTLSRFFYRIVCAKLSSTGDNTLLIKDNKQPTTKNPNVKKSNFIKFRVLASKKKILLFVQYKSISERKILD